MVTLSRGDRMGNRLFCHESSSCDHFVADGGAEVLVVNLMPRFRALGHEVGVHDDRQYYQQIAARCYERAKEFNISKMASAYAEVYEKVRGKGKKVRR